jgi:hypothetical protein
MYCNLPFTRYYYAKQVKEHERNETKMRNSYILVDNPEGNRSFGRPNSEWKYIKIDFKELGCEGALFSFIRIWFTGRLL